MAAQNGHAGGGRHSPRLTHEQLHDLGHRVEGGRAVRLDDATPDESWGLDRLAEADITAHEREHVLPLVTAGSNRKVGRTVMVFNLPAGADSCPGRSPACESVCYAKRGYGGYWRGRYARNLAASRTDGFVPQVVAEVRASGLPLLRVHSSGDFYGPEYVRKWGQIAAAVPEVRLWAYTRSWRVPAILDELRRLADLPNFSLWFSADRDTGLPPQVGRVRACWLRVRDELPPAPAAGQTGVGLVFPAKVRGRVPLKLAGGALVCPNYNGTPQGAATTCDACRFCFTEKSAVSSNREAGGV
jgi:hypothetical protein